jgi:hypothetical protein
VPESHKALAQRRVTGRLLTGSLPGRVSPGELRTDYVWRGAARPQWALDAIAAAEREHGVPRAAAGQSRQVPCGICGHLFTVVIPAHGGTPPSYCGDECRRVRDKRREARRRQRDMEAERQAAEQEAAAGGAESRAGAPRALSLVPDVPQPPPQPQAPAESHGGRPEPERPDGCTCPWAWKSQGYLHGVSAGSGWVRMRTVPGCPVHDEYCRRCRYRADRCRCEWMRS